MYTITTACRVEGGPIPFSYRRAATISRAAATGSGQFPSGYSYLHRAAEKCACACKKARPPSAADWEKQQQQQIPTISETSVVGCFTIICLFNNPHGVLPEHLPALIEIIHRPCTEPDRTPGSCRQRSSKLVTMNKTFG